VGEHFRRGLAHILADGSVAAWAPNLGTALALAVSGGTVFAGGTFGLVALDATSGGDPVECRRECPACVRWS
jgi:hypothetical protein